MAVVCDPERVRTRAADLVATQPGVPAGVLGGHRGRRRGADRRRRGLAVVHRGRPGARPRAGHDVVVGVARSPPTTRSTEADTLKLGMHAPETYRGDTAKALADTKGWLADGWRAVYVTEGHGPAARTVEVLGGEGIAARLDTDLGDPQPLRRARRLRLDRPRLRRPRAPAGRPHRDRPDRPEGRGPRGRPDARPPPQDHRPAHPGDGRLHRPRAARRGPLHRDGAAHRAGRHPRVPGRGVRPRQARPARRPAVHPHRPAGADHQVRRRRGPHPAPARRRRLDQDQGPGEEGGQGDRRRPDQAVQRADGGPRPRLRPRHPLAARAGGRLPVRRDPRPAHDHRRGQGGHGEVGPDGPPDLRRRRLRQDRDRGPRRLQGGAGRQAGRRAGADDAAGPAALRDVLRAVLASSR